MKPFLYQVAEAFYREGGQEERIAFVFPNRRSGKFFQRYVEKVAGRTIFSPTILTVNNLIAKLSGLQHIDKIDLLFTLYEEYIKLRQNDEPFDKFVFWGEMLISDFDDIDKYMVDARKLLANIKDLKDLDQPFLNEEQMEIIRQFWGVLVNPSKGEMREEFITLWSILYDLYNNLRERLLKQGVGYEGMLFRQVAEKAQQGMLPALPYDKVVFVGFNVITEAERIIFSYFRDNRQGDFYWDFYAPTLTYDGGKNGKNDNKAGYFLAQNKREFPSHRKLSEEYTITTAPEMTVMAVSSAVGQVKQAGSILQKLINEGHTPASDAINTAVVLPDEDLLVPMIYSLPADITGVNITMGYSLHNTSIVSLFEAIFRVQRHIQYRSGNAYYYHVEVAAVLNHRLVRSIVDNKLLDNILSQMNIKNMAYVSGDFVACHELLELIFTPIRQLSQACAYLESVINHILDNLEEAQEPAEDAKEAIGMEQMEYEYAYHYATIISRLNDVISDHNIDMLVDTYFGILSKMSLSIPFEGEPLEGLQLMGVLETRSLDFENIIILSMNDGMFPMKKVANSFIPYNLRRGFGMATTEHQDSIYAYYFYRLIGRAKRVYMLYDSRTDGIKRCEVSRFIYQLKYHYSKILPQYKIKELMISHGVSLENEPPIVIQKNDHVRKKLNVYLKSGDGEKRPLSASSVKTYINCPLQFYLKHIEGMNPDNEISELVDSSVFGSIYHNVMAQIYNELKGDKEEVVVTDEMLEDVIKQDNHNHIMQMIVEQFNTIFYHRSKEHRQQPLSGQNQIIAHTVLTYVIQTLSHDKEMYAKGRGFSYVASEKRLDEGLSIPLKSGKDVLFKAFIDRIDIVNDCVRIIDYKTGNDTHSFPAVEEIFKTDADKSYGAIFQVLLYCKLYRLMYPEDTRLLQPLIYKVKKAFSELSPTLSCNRQKVDAYEGEIMEEYEKYLDECLEKIFDDETPFAQTQNLKNCTFCDFKTICKR